MVGDAFEHAVALDEDVLVRVDEDVADGRVAQQRLERPEAEHLVDQFAEQHVAFAEAERGVLFGEQFADSVRISLSARARSAFASASRLRRLSSLR